MILEALRGARLAARLVAPGRARGFGVERDLRTARGALYDLYEPCGGARRTAVVVHGVTVSGKDDARLTDFARCLAASGLRAAVIELAGLKGCVFSPEDIEAIEDLCLELSGRREPVGLIGFSYGGGLALTAAAGERLRGAVDRLLLFGAYHSLDELWREYLERFDAPPEREEEWHDYLYLRLVLALPQAARLGLDDAARGRILAVLRAYCTDLSLTAKREAHRPIEALPLAELERGCPYASLGPQVSAAGRLAGLAARVHLLHDSGDRLIPPSHSERILAELGPAAKARLLVTPLLSHVAPGSWRGAADVPALLTILGGALG